MDFKQTKFIRGIGLALIITGTISCVGVGSEINTFLEKREFKYLQDVQRSPFFDLPSEGFGDIDFFFDFNGFWKENLYNVEMVYSFNPKELIFVKREGKHTSELTIRVECYDKAGDLGFFKEWDEILTANDYKSTRVDWVILKRKVFQLEPGEYKIISSFKDKNSKITAKVERSHVIIEPFNTTDLQVSDIRFVDYRNNLFEINELNSQNEEYTNKQHANRFFKDSLQIFYEVYNNDGSVPIEYAIFNKTGKQILPDSLRADSIEKEKTISLDISYFSEGWYLLSIKTGADSLGGGISKQFSVLNIRLDLENNFKETIRLINYYINYEEGSLKDMKKSNTGKERRDAWKEFWKQFDPSPNTEENEYLDKFTDRVHFANLNFESQIRKGSYTPMGQVYICLGPPDDVYFRNMPQEMNAYEIWEYYRTFASTPAKIFYFYDENGLDVKGDYRLVNEPDTPRWFEY